MDKHMADTARRLVAAGADILIALILYLFLTWPAGRFVAGLGAAAFLLLRDSLDWSPYQGLSPGKRLLHLKVLQERDHPCDHVASIKRNLPVAAYFLIVSLLTPLCHMIPFVEPAAAVVLGALVGLTAMGMELYLLLTDSSGRRFGDLLAGTRVVETDGALPHPRS